jgi:CDP-diacylglycerol--serine O-phosphatidyltransferase
MDPTDRRDDRGVPVKYLIPNLITTISLCCGLASIHFAIQAAFPKIPTGAADVVAAVSLPSPRFNNWDRALACVVLAMIFDGMDGRAARLLRGSSRFGAVLDSLSDFVCFGVAPALILYLWGLRGENTLGFAAVVVFTLCSGFRLARFTASIPASGGDTNRIAAIMKNYFTGCPTPAAAGAVLAPIMLLESKFTDWRMPSEWVIAHTIFIAWLMISRRPMFSFKRIRVPRMAVVPLLVVVGLVLAMGVKDPWLTVSILAWAYIASMPLAMTLFHRAMVQEGVRGAATWSAGLSVREQIRLSSKDAA